MNSSVLKPIFYLIVLLSILSGCATVDQKINLTYKPVYRPSGGNSGEVLVSSVYTSSPLRNAKGEWIVGTLNNVHGVRQADILSDRTIGDWLAEAIMQELKQAGYTSTYAARLPTGVTRAVVVNDINIFMTVNKGNVSAETRQDMKFNVEVIKNGLKIKTLSISTRDKKTLALSASQEEIESIMRQSLQDALLQLVPDLIVLLDNK